MSEPLVIPEDLQHLANMLCADRNNGLTNATCWQLIERIAKLKADLAAANANLERMGRAEHEMYEDGRCQICGWTLCKSIADGRTAESCSMRPQEGSPDWYRLKERREWLLARRGEGL